MTYMQIIHAWICCCDDTSADSSPMLWISAYLNPADQIFCDAPDQAWWGWA